MEPHHPPIRPEPSWTRRRVAATAATALGGLAAAPALTACGGDEPGRSVGGGGGRRRELTFACAAFTGGAAGMQSFADRYNATQTRYRVTVRNLPPPSSSTECHQQLTQLLARKDGTVDVFAQDVVWIAELAEAGWAHPLDGDVSAALRRSFFPGVVEACTYRGRLVALPWYVDAGGLYYRTDLMRALGRKPPTDWHELADLAAEMQHRRVPMGYLWQAKQAEILLCDLVEFIASNRGHIIDPSGAVRVDGAACVEAVQFMRDLVYRYKVSPSEVFSWDEEPSRRPFTAGRVGMMRHWSYVYGVSQNPDQSKVVGKVDVAPLPSFPGGTSSSCLGGYQLGVAAGSRNKEGAMDFLHWLAGTEAQLAFALDFGNAPSRVSVYDEKKLAEGQPAMVKLKEAFGNGVPRPVTPHYSRVSLALQSAVSRALVYGDVRGTLRSARRDLEAIV
ncbi:ABC transporter substrate-binding protein [Streptomyces asiaticus]|uniref:ABC transporter substrate-binding protein n=1 Tax=Streptomyces asiaticus TaxID=114695 RepID=UPI0039BE809F